MRYLVDCLNKHSKLISKQDADALVVSARALQAGGLNQFAAEQEAVKNALREANEAGESILNQIQTMRPQAHAQAVEFWNRETIRKAQAPPPLPRYVTEAREVPAPAAPAPTPVSEIPAQAPRARVEAPPAPVPVAPAAPPEIPAAPISDAAQEMVDSLPPEQRAAAQKAVAQDDRDPLADQQRKNGQPVPKRRSKPVAPEKNRKLFDGVSRLGIFDKTPTEVLGNIASDPKNPRWIRAVADLLIQIGLGEGVDIRAVNTPNAAWGALYNVNGINGRPEVLINLSYAQGGAELSRRVLHELIHHGTLMKLGEAESKLTPGALAAKRELEKIFKYVTDNPNKFSGAAKEFGAFNNLAEFVSEVFANDTLRRQLNSVRPDGKISILQRIADEILNLLISDRGMGMRKGSMLEAAVKGTIDVAGSSLPVTGAGGPTTAAAQAARLANAFPNFQEQIANTVAPMADNMGISDNDLIERKLDHKAAFYAEDERAAVESAVDERAGKINATPAEIADVKRRIEDEVKYYRAYHPANSGWANKAIKVLGLEEKKGLTRGDPTKQNPSGIAFKIKYKDTPYTYARDAEGKPIQRFLKQGKPDKETGKPIDNPEWGKRVGQLAQKMFDNLQGIMARRDAGGEDGRIARVILDQINWYRDMRTRLRAEFGSMSDYVADVIAGFSPITDVPGNWNNFIEYFRHVMRGDYDEAFRKFDEYISADPENRSSGTYKKEFPPEDFPQLWPRKLLKEDQPLFGANTGNALMAGLDMWRAIKSGTAPKARNFGLNLIGQSLKATIDRWAGRYLQRMHAPTWRIPPSIEGAVTGGHMPGANVELVSGDFGMGQDVFEDVAKRLQASGIPEFKEVTAADLQAILWFAEKEIWEMRKYTDIMGAGSSMNLVAQATAAQRYEAGAAPGKTSAKDEKLMAETIELRTNLNAEAHMLGAKMVPSVNIDEGKESKTFDGEWVTEPEYDPENSIGYVAKIAAELGRKAAHISRVIVNEYEPNPEITPGLHIFFKGRVGDAQVKGVLAALKKAGISNGIRLTVDPRVRPEVIKSLDPAAGANQYNGVRVQFVPYDEAAKQLTRDQIEEAFGDVKVALANNASVAESRVLYYDTLVLKKGTDYDSSGKLTKNFSEGRAKAWTGRARSEGAAAAARRDNVQKAIADRKRQDLELESRMEREEQERIAAYAAFQRSQAIPVPDKSIDGGVDIPGATVAPMREVEPREGFFSGVSKILNRKMPNAAPAQQVKAIIRDAPQEDIKWSGVNQAIDRIAEENNGKVPKDALLDYLRDDGAVRLEEHRLASKSPYPYTTANEWQQAIDRAEANQNWDEAERIQRAWDGLDEETGSTVGQPKFAQYTIPGGENYREVVLAMPDRESVFEVYNLQTGEVLATVNSREEASRMVRGGPGLAYSTDRQTEQYTSSHFPDVPNYVAHARMNDRVDAQGKPGLFLEEIQSDRHQAGREKGYAGEVVKYHDAYYVTEDGQEVTVGMGRTAEEAKKDAGEYWADKVTVLTRPVVAKEGIADAPFRKDWPVQMFKRALRDAIASGKDWIGWTSGDTQAERYDLSKQVDEIAVNRLVNGKFRIDAIKDEQEVMTRDASAMELPDIVGKELAEKITQQTDDFKSYSGVDLKVGGEGMKGFYDKMLPNEVQKYVKQWGGKVEPGVVNTPYYRDDRQQYDVIKPDGTVDRSIWKVEITPQMKETIPVKGQSLFGAVAPMREQITYEDEQQPTRDPHGGRASLVRSMVDRIRNLGRDKEGIEIPESAQEVRGLAGAGGGARASGGGPASVWRNLGETFARREAGLARRVGAAADIIKAGNPEDPDLPKEDPARYQNSQRLFDYLTGKETPSDPELQAQVAELRKEVPTVPVAAFENRLSELDAGVEADVYHDEEAGVAYKLYKIKEGKFGGYVPGQLRMQDKQVVPGMGGKPTLADLMGRMERSNAHGLAPNELIAVTPEGHAVFAQPFIAGRGVTGKNIRPALARAGVHLLSDLGGVSGVAKLEDGRWVLFDDLHYGNVRTLPGGRVEIIDANNRELDEYEIADLQTLGMLPKEKPLNPPKAPASKKSQKYANATVVAPMVETHHGTPHDWAPEVKIRFYDGREQWFQQESLDRAGLPEGATIIQRAPAGRVRKDKVGTGESNAAFGWGVLYSAARRGLAENYRKTLSEGMGNWLLDGGDISDASPKIINQDEWETLRRALSMTEDESTIHINIANWRNEAKWAEQHSALAAFGSPQERSADWQQRRDQFTRLADVLEKYRDRIQFRKGGGNVYTVQLDVNDPELLDWFKPMKDQMFVFDKVAAKFGVTRESAKAAHIENERLAGESEELGFEDAPQEEIDAAEERWHKHYQQADTKFGSMLYKIERGRQWGAREFDGEKFYSWMTDMIMGGSTQAASEYMDQAGVPGIVFIDRESRKVNVWSGTDAYGKTKWIASVPGRPDGENQFDTEAEAKAFAKTKTFNNYVIFDPERIKVVAKNGEVVRTAADDLPPPPQPSVEPVTVAAMEEVKDTDLSVAPMAGRGSRARRPWFRSSATVPGYKPGGLLTPHAQLNKAAGNFVQEREQREKAVAYRAESMVRDLERSLKAGYGKAGPDKTQLADVQVALGNLDTRLTPEQYDEALKYKDPYARKSFEETARNENVDTARANQQSALARLPEVVRKYVGKLRAKLDTEAKELLKDPGIDTELRARVNSELGVFLHADSYQHFESDVWEKHIKSDDPEAQRIRRNAEILFKNEILGEQAHAYQVAQAKLGITVSDADALAHAAAMPNINQMVKNRLAAYLRKNANEATRMHLLTGKMPIAKVPESQKLLSLSRENIPQEVRELWGQWTDPRINFVKTYTLLANHNANIRMQQSIVEDGQDNGYIWKPDPADPTSSPGEGLVPLGKAGDDGPFADAYGPQLLKDGLANLNKPEVQDFLVGINRWALMSKTVGSIASAVHNFLGNIGFSIANGNLLWAITLAPKTLISSSFESFVTTYGRATGTGSPATQDKINEMIELGIFDSDIAINTIRDMARAAQAGIAVEKRLGPAAGLHAVGKALSKTGGAFKQTYQAADNWWKYFNYQIELAKQQWFYSHMASPPSLDEMKRAAANQVKNTLPSYSRVPEIVRRGLSESPLKYSGAFFTFQTESARTAINNGRTAWGEFAEGNWKQKAFAGYRTTGMMAMLTMPYLLGSLAKWMFGYDDEDEEALRNSLPDYQKNASLLIMLPKDEKGNPRYVDASFFNPYGLFHSAGIAGTRSYQQDRSMPKAVGKASLHLLQPLMTIQPGIATLMGAVINTDFTRGGAKIYNPQDSFANQAKDVSDWFARGFLPGTVTNAWKAIQSGRGIKESSGREPDPLQDITAGLAGAPRFSTLELDRAMHSHVGKYEKNMNDTMRLLNEVIRTKATVSEGEVADAYRQANAKSEEHFNEMHKAYRQMIELKKLTMDEAAAEAAAEEEMQIGFGTEKIKEGLGKNKIGNIIEGVYLPLEISKRKAEEAEEYHPERLDEYNQALEEAQKAYDLSHP